MMAFLPAKRPYEESNPVGRVENGRRVDWEMSWQLRAVKGWLDCLGNLRVGVVRIVKNPRQRT